MVLAKKPSLVCVEIVAGVFVERLSLARYLVAIAKSAQIQGWRVQWKVGRGLKNCVARGEILGPTHDYLRQKLLLARYTFINQERKLGDRRRLETVVVLTLNYTD